MENKTSNHNKRLLTLLVTLLLSFTFGMTQSLTVYPNIAYRGQTNNFIVSGTGVTFASISASYLFGPGGPYYNIYPSGNGGTINFNTILPSSTPLGTYTFGITYMIGGGLSTPNAVTVIDPPANSGRITGLVFRGNNCNGSTYLGNRLVLVNPGGYVVSTNYFGQYSVFVPAGGTYSVVALPSQIDNMACPAAPYNVTVTNVGQVVSNQNFAMEQLPVADPEPWVGPAIHRPGFTVANSVSVHNNGILSATGISLKLHVPNWLGYVSNTGGGTFLNDTITWSIPFLAGNADISFQFTVVPPINSLGAGYAYSVSLTSSSADAFQDNNNKVFSGIVSGSYDPNDKQVHTQDVVNADGPINPTDSILTYLVRFQNTGTDTAFNIRINDTIDSNLDFSTLQITQSSHPCQVEVVSNNEVNFHFPNILLLDSNANEPLSHGYIEYKIMRKPNLPIGTEIENEANIYFDYNLPVLTNKVISKICPPALLDFSTSTNLTTLSIVNNTTGGPGSISWDFGDGGTSSANSPSHTYTYGGNYVVCLNFTDTCGTRTLCELVSITCAALTADFGFNAMGSQVQFMDLTADSIVSWAWDFGDGNTSTATSPLHNYAISGSYSACLVVTNNCGVMDTTCETLTVVGMQDSPFRSLQLYPNPNDGIFNLTVEFAETGLLRAEIYDLTGRILYESDWGEVQGQYKKNMEMNLPAGSYFLQLELNGRKVNRMFNVR